MSYRRTLMAWTLLFAADARMCRLPRDLPLGHWGIIPRPRELCLVQACNWATESWSTLTCPRATSLTQVSSIPI